VCQAAKTSKTKSSGNRIRLYAGRPWQHIAIDLVGPLSETNRRNRWILVLSDHFTRWQDAIPLPDATAPTVADALDSRVFSYLGLPETIGSDQGAQFQSELMEELCELWRVDKRRTTPFHPSGNGVCERGNHTLGNSLRALLLNQCAHEDDWDMLLPQIMRAIRATPHTATKETPNYMLLGRQLRLPDSLIYPVPPDKPKPVQKYVMDMEDRLRAAHDALRKDQHNIVQNDFQEPPLYKVGDQVLLQSKRKRKGRSTKLQPKFCGPYLITKTWNNHTYQIEKNGQVSVQHESRLKPYRISQHASGQAPAVLEPIRRPNMKGAIDKRQKSSSEAISSQAINDNTGADNPQLGNQMESNSGSKIEVTPKPTNTGQPAPIGEDDKINEQDTQPSCPARTGRLRKLPQHLADYILGYTSLSYIDSY
jgi:hypothetical protein